MKEWHNGTSFPAVEFRNSTHPNKHSNQPENKVLKRITPTFTSISDTIKSSPGKPPEYRTWQWKPPPLGGLQPACDPGRG